jgi:predicted metal-dependent peptidase
LWTDSQALGFNPGYVDSLADVQLKGMLAKAVLHIAAGHPWRQDHREPSRWNEACTQAVVGLLTAAGMRLPDGIVANPDYFGLAAEAIYTRLPQPPTQEQGDQSDEGAEAPEQSQAAGAPPHGGDAAGDDESGQGPSDGDDEGESSNPGKDGSGSGNSGDLAEPVSQGKPMPPVEVRPAPQGTENQAEWQMAMGTAIRMQGNLPGGMDELVSGMLRPSVDWREALRNFFETSMSLQDYSWTRPNTRYLASGLYLPSLQGQGVSAIVVVRDTSGSVDETYARRFNSELADILSTIKPEMLYVIDADAAVQRVQELEVGSDELDLDLTLKGRGGTHFGPPFQWVREQGIDCKCLIYLTDLDGPFPAEEPEYPTLWAVPEGTRQGRKPPFGELLEIEL